MRNLLIAIFFMIATSCITQQATAKIYTWTDEKGVTHFTDYPPATKQDVKTIKTKNYPPPAPSENAETAATPETQVEKRTPPDSASAEQKNRKSKEKKQTNDVVVIYTTSW